MLSHPTVRDMVASTHALRSPEPVGMALLGNDGLCFAGVRNERFSRPRAWESRFDHRSACERAVRGYVLRVRGEEDHLSVSDAAAALGTSPQTVRALLRKGQLRGAQRPWGSRFVWEVSRAGLAEFLAQYGRLDGQRRSKVAAHVDTLEREVPTPIAEAPVAPDRTSSLEDLLVRTGEPIEPRRGGRPWFLRPRGRAIVVLVLLGIPLLTAYAAARIVPDALWFAEVGQQDVFRRLVQAEVEVRFAFGASAAAFVWLNLRIAGRGTWLAERMSGFLAVGGVAMVIGTRFASSAGQHWQTYVLWRHPQTFGVTDPVHGKDVGYFVFTLPFEVLVSGMLLWLVAVTFGWVLAVHAVRGTVGVRPRRASFAAQVHLALLLAAFLLAAAWRLALERYLLELHQPRGGGDQPFAGVGYVDVHVRTPVLTSLAIAAVVLAFVCAAAPWLARLRWVRRARKVVAIGGLVAAAGVVLALTLLPALVQRWVVDPNQLASEAPYLERSAAATRQALGLDQIDVEPYSSAGQLPAADFRTVDDRLSLVTTWDSALLGARMQQMVTDTPYFSPQTPNLDVVRAGGESQLTIVSARELNPGAGDLDTGTWSSNRLAYTHGLGLIRFSATGVGPDREPVLLDSGASVLQPRIYFGNLDGADGDVEPATGLADSPWVLVDTRRPEVDVASSHATSPVPYHYGGTAGIALSSWTRRAIFALALGSKQVLLSDDLTSDSRILLHRDVHDRLQTLAPFIQWDGDAFPLTIGDRILHVVDGYTTSSDYPFAQQVALGGSQVSYARASVRATVDAYSGEIALYVTGPDDPLIRAWSAAFPGLFHAADQAPAELRQRGRYPGELFEAQALAYERFHTENPDTLASGSDLWTRPIALSGPLEVAGGVDFDESDEDDLRLTLQPEYLYAPPPGTDIDQARLVLQTYYTPQRGQNLVATLSGWVDGLGRTHLVSRSLPRDPVVLGPAQISRLVFATPRVRNLLGLRNLEIRDLDTSSLDSVYIGRPHLLLLPEGPVQIQSLFEGSRGPGAARLLGVTVFVNGRAGLGPDVTSALRQAINSPPQVELRSPSGPAAVGTPVQLSFRVENARREIVTITWGDHHKRMHLRVAAGRGSFEWVPPEAGDVRVRIAVNGLDGTTVTDAISFQVLSRPPVVRILSAPQEAVVGQPVVITFRLTHGRHASARVSTPSGIVLTREYVLRNNIGILKWTPDSPGRTDILLNAEGRQGQTAHTSLRLRVRPAAVVTPPVVQILRQPAKITVGTPATFVVSAQSCQDLAARIRGPEGDAEVWRFPCPAERASFDWAAKTPGTYELTVVARSSEGLTASQTVSLVARDPDARTTR